MLLSRAIANVASSQLLVWFAAKAMSTAAAILQGAGGVAVNNAVPIIGSGSRLGHSLPIHVMNKPAPHQPWAKELHSRPAFHVQPMPRSWINDPNGIHYDPRTQMYHMVRGWAGYNF